MMDVPKAIEDIYLYEENLSGAVSGTVSEGDPESGDDISHDLPSVEGYRSSMVSPSQGFQKRKGNAEVGVSMDESEYTQDQLPSVEEYKSGSSALSASRGRGLLFYFAIFFGMVVIAAVIAIPVVLTRDNRMEQKSASDGDASTLVPARPGENRRSIFIEHLVNAGISTEAQLTTSGTPQSMALEWMASDLFQEPLPTTVKKYSRFIERYVLAVIYFSTNGSKWTHDMRFMMPIDHCDWNSNFLVSDGEIVRYGVARCDSVAESTETAGGRMVTELLLRKCISCRRYDRALNVLIWCFLAYLQHTMACQDFFHTRFNTSIGWRHFRSITTLF